MFAAIDWSQLPKQFLVWTFICCASAVTSFVWASFLHNDPIQIAAMATGVMIFIAGYTLLASSHAMKGLRRQNKALRVTLRIGYITRMVLSAIWPAGMFVDIWIGFVATSIVQGCTTGEFTPDGYADDSEKFGFFKILATTLVQGILLNVALFIYMSIFYFLLRLWLPTRLPEGLCRKCGYDLRASPDICPECGTPNSRQRPAVPSSTMHVA